MKYTCYGYTFGVEKSKSSGKWWCIGHAQGRKPYLLYKLGTAETDEAAQRKLDGWARHVQASRVTPAVPAFEYKRPAVEELDLFARVGV
jgi:hypothetical protein